MICTDIIHLYILLFLAGATFGGRIITGLSWLVEYNHSKKKQMVVFIKMMSVNFWIILMTFIFQFGTKHWKIVASVFLTMCIIGTIYVTTFVPESVEFLHEIGEYDEARQNLTKVANMNSVKFVGKNQVAYNKFKFSRELDLTAKDTAALKGSIQDSDSLEVKSGSLESDKNSVEEEYMFTKYDEIAKSNYTKNILILCVQWSAASFGVYLLMYLNKYLSGSIYLNFYFDGISGVVAYTIGAPLYRYCRIRNAFIISNTIACVGALGLILFESGAISPYFIDSLGCPPSDYPEGSPKDREYHLKKIIPWFSFTAKVGTAITFSNSFQASFSDQRVFPFIKRATATGICNFVGRGLTVFSPLVAELDKPIPSSILFGISAIALIVALFLPSKSEEL
jgi:hypothetical protein